MATARVPQSALGKEYVHGGVKYALELIFGAEHDVHRGAVCIQILEGVERLTRSNGAVARLGAS